jgi:hypothetical protein
MDSGIIPGSPLFSLESWQVHFAPPILNPAAAAVVCPENRERFIMFAAVTQNDRHKNKPTALG